MNNFKISFIEQLPDEILEKVEKGLIEYETSQGIDVNYQTFCLVLTDEKEEELIGILNAYTAFAEIYIDDIWVEKSQRGNGYGRKLLVELENRFKGKGFNNMNLVTSEFQGPDFYKKCGFTAEFVRVNKANPKLTKTFFVKYFDDQNQIQGLK